MYTCTRLPKYWYASPNSFAGSTVTSDTVSSRVLLVPELSKVCVTMPWAFNCKHNSLFSASNTTEGGKEGMTRMMVRFGHLSMLNSIKQTDPLFPLSPPPHSLLSSPLPCTIGSGLDPLFPLSTSFPPLLSSPPTLYNRLRFRECTQSPIQGINLTNID